ncbi:hypothetical protein GCM10010174_29180 [Kutzneria viridogrisea]|uniref:Response regulatory domain-containing protein n=2 Tax=Kutzneria TaxID=43356 RepID=W5WBL5_9PSEU|nr:fused response regulator/phosphatase [Kutzneria albida]AHH97936.1 hypothetical protein KALB_4574 [Kutzneria albida DSM 43870]MBA8924408.1 CheY-like chemotaxis protein [Kutzneria viridogrisea]
MSPHLRHISADLPARILVVDDNEASRYITASWLRRDRHEVVEAADGTSALAVLREQAVDLVVLDVNLPDISGFEVCERIKEDPATAVLPVIHVSATLVDPAERAQGLTRGADAFMSEPVDPTELLATVTAALRYYRARSAAERLARRLNQLTRSSLLVNAATTFSALITAAVRGAATIFDSGTSVLLALSDGREWQATTEGPDQRVSTHEEQSGLLERLAEQAFDGQVGAALVTLAAADSPTGDQAVAVVVRTKLDQPPCCIALPAEAAALPEDHDLLLQLGQATAVAAQGLRAYAAEHTLALTLQRSLLPRGLPHREDLLMAARYVPASDAAEIGGDFYEVTELGDRLLVAIGDVTGHSIEAATVMGEVRHALRAYAVDGHGPAEILLRLDAMLRRFHPTGFTTVCLMVVDPGAGTVEIANAGHIPPLFVDADGARYVPLPGALLGIGVPRPPSTVLPLPPGTSVVLMTDGLVERRGVPLDEDLEVLRAGMLGDESPDALCGRLLAQFGQGKDDDIAVLVLQRPGSP